MNRRDRYDVAEAQADATPPRRRLPNRRSSETHALSVGNHRFTATVGFDPANGQPQEVFLDGPKDGTELAAILDDASVVLSLAMQHGIRPATLAKSVARIPLVPLTPADLAEVTGPRQTAPASVIGAVLDLLRGLEDA